MIPEALALLLFGIAGACLGSFTVTSAMRAARQESFGLNRSHCDDCGVKLGFGATIPIMSYLYRKGACSFCGAKIADIHLAGEAAGAAIAISTLMIAPHPQSILLAPLGYLLLAASAYDVRVLRLPDMLNLCIAVLGVSLAALGGPTVVFEGVCASATCLVVLSFLAIGYKKVRGRPGLGMGDVKLVSALALWLGLATPLALVLSCVFGLAGSIVLHRTLHRFAFGPYLALGAWIVGLAHGPLLSALA